MKRARKENPRLTDAPRFLVGFAVLIILLALGAVVYPCSAAEAPKAARNRTPSPS